MGSTPTSFSKYNGVLEHKTLYYTKRKCALTWTVCSCLPPMSTFFAGCLPDAGKPACISSWFGVALGGSQQTARADSGTDSMDWIAAAEATLGTKKEIKRQRLLRSDTSREELPSPAHQKQKTESRKQRVEKSRYRQRHLPESPGCQYTVRERLVFK